MAKQKMATFQPEQFFYLLSDETRLRCLALLQLKGELCVCDLMTALDMIQPKISRHLAILKKFEVVLDRRSGTWIYYRINPELPIWANQVLSNMVIGIAEQKPFVIDRARLNKDNTLSSCC